MHCTCVMSQRDGSLAGDRDSAEVPSRTCSAARFRTTPHMPVLGCSGSVVPSDAKLYYLAMGVFALHLPIPSWKTIRCRIPEM